MNLFRRKMKHPPCFLPRVLLSTVGQAGSRGGRALISIAKQLSERRREGGESVLCRAHWEQPGPFEVVICPDSGEGRQIEMSFDNNRQSQLSSDLATTGDREKGRQEGTGMQTEKGTRTEKNK